MSSPQAHDASGTRSPATRREQIEASLVRAAPQMDLAPLLHALHSIGYRISPVWFRRLSFHAPPPLRRRVPLR
jgi:hypothetical protein